MYGGTLVTAIPSDPGDILTLDGYTPVAVEARDDFQSLVHFQHPLNAIYCFGPEDGSITPRISSRAHSHVVIPTKFCLNLAMAVGIVLYDRIAKLTLAGALPLEFEGRNVVKEITGGFDTR